uniref:Gnk2-homologous domain-containing protein n=1 Tax=Opuntia streptacantha TaxID=393608 RepID=A0A7C8Z9J5_OPUST
MASSRHFVVAHVVLFLVITSSLAYEDPAGTYCNPNSPVDPGSLLATYIGDLLASLVPACSRFATFIASSNGNDETIVYGMAQCRGDIWGKLCCLCIEAAADQIQKSCPNSSDAQIWYNHCTVGYSQHRFFGKFDTSNGVVSIRNQEDYSDPQALSDLLGSLFNELSTEAINPKGKGFAAGQANLTDSDTLYGMAQCTKDLPPFACSQCLDAAIKQSQSSCGPSKGCRVFYSACVVRYELYPFIPYGISGQVEEKLTIHHEFHKENKFMS